MKKLIAAAGEDWVAVLRGLVYAVTVLGTPVVAYAATKGVIGDAEVQLWSAEVAAAGTLAGANVVRRRRARPRDDS